MKHNPLTFLGIILLLITGADIANYLVMGLIVLGCGLVMLVLDNMGDFSNKVPVTGTI